MPAAVKPRLDARTDRQRQSRERETERQRERERETRSALRSHSQVDSHTHEELGRLFFLLKFTQDFKTEPREREIVPGSLQKCMFGNRVGCASSPADPVLFDTWVH